MLGSQGPMRRLVYSTPKTSPPRKSAARLGGASQGGSGAASTAVRQHALNNSAQLALDSAGGRRNAHNQRQHGRLTVGAMAPPPVESSFRRLPDRGRLIHSRPGPSHGRRRPPSVAPPSLVDAANWHSPGDGNTSATATLDAYASAMDAFAVQDYGMPHHVDDFLPPDAVQPLDEADATTITVLGNLTKAHNVKLAAVALCAVLGALCILLNAFVIGSLLANRRRVLTNVFYVLVLHCALVDLIRGGCLVAYGLPHFLLLYTTTMESRKFALKINQFTLMILRSCNLLTIFNLLVFTTNEFIVIRYPLHYRRYFLRKTVLVILAISWLVSILFGVGSALAHILRPPNLQLMVRQPEERGGVTMMRRDTDDLPLSVICMMASFMLCYVCLVIVLICYGTILNTIRNFHNAEKRNASTGSGKSARLDGDARFGGGCGSAGTQRSASLYQKRYHHDVLKQQSPTARPSHSKHQANNHSPVSLRGSNVVPAPFCGVKVDVTPCSASNSAASTPKSSCAHGPPHNGADDPTNPASTAHNNNNNNNNSNSTRLGRCNSHRKWKSHLMSRHKYLIVIGTVLFVDILFLIPYSAIQMVAIVHLHRMMAASTQSTLIRWGLQILIGVHSVCQPLCYFRMNEFRRLACCKGGGRVGSRRSGGGSGSSVADTTAATAAVASRRRRGFFSRSKSMSHSRDPRSETETCALQSTTSVGNLTRRKAKGTAAAATAAVLVESTRPAADSPTARRRLYKQHKNSKAGSFSSSFGSKMSALRRLSSSSLVLQASACLVTVNVEDVDGDRSLSDSYPPMVDGVYDYGAHLSRVADGDDDGGYRFHSIETIPSASNEESSLGIDPNASSPSAASEHCTNGGRGQFEPCSSPCANGAAHVIEVDARVRPQRDRRRHSTTLAAAAALGSFADTLRHAFSFRRPKRRPRHNEPDEAAMDAELERVSEANRLLRGYYAPTDDAEADRMPEASRFRRRADLLNTDNSRNGRLSTLSDLRSSFSSAAGEHEEEAEAEASQPQPDGL